MHNYRLAIAEALDGVNDKSFIATVVRYGLTTLIILNVLAIVLNTVPEYQLRFQQEFIWFEHSCLAIFAIEYGLRLWTCVEYQANSQSAWQMRLRYLLTPMALIDLLAILPLFLAWFGNDDWFWLLILRLLRIFKLTRYSKAMNVLFTVLKEESSPLLATFFITTVVMTFAACGIYLIEQHVQPDKFGSIPQAMWWAMATLTTVGYGDVVPITPLGKLFGGMITLASIGLVAIPAGILASGFTRQIHQRRQEYEILVKQALKHGHITASEQQALLRLQHKLDIDDKEAHILLMAAMQSSGLKDLHCPHCHRSILAEANAQNNNNQE